MKRMRFVFALLVIGSIQNIRAEEEGASKIKLEAGFDLATTYLWRGFEFGNGPVIQPWTRLSYGGLSAGVWSTTNFIGDSKEVDLYASYNFKNVTLSFTDFFSMGIAGLDQNYFNFGSSTSIHIAELGLSYEGSENFPLTLSGGIFVYGLALDPKVNDSGKLNHSTYFEVGYPGTIMDYTYSLFAGFVPTESSFYQTGKFSFINVGCKVGKSFPITAQFSIPTTLTLSTSPERKTVCLAVMCSF